MEGSDCSQCACSSGSDMQLFHFSFFSLLFDFIDDDGAESREKKSASRANEISSCLFDCLFFVECVHWNTNSVTQWKEMPAYPCIAAAHVCASSTRWHYVLYRLEVKPADIDQSERVIMGAFCFWALSRWQRSSETARTTLAFLWALMDVYVFLSTLPQKRLRGFLSWKPKAVYVAGCVGAGILVTRTMR